MKIAVFIVFSLVVTCLGVSFALSDRSKWIETNAVIIKADVFEDRRRQGVFTPYYIDGQIEYTSPKGKHSFKINKLRREIPDRKSAEELAQKLLGSKMAIKYDPNKPFSWFLLNK